MAAASKTEKRSRSTSRKRTTTTTTTTTTPVKRASRAAADSKKGATPSKSKGGKTAASPAASRSRSRTPSSSTARARSTSTRRKAAGAGGASRAKVHGAGTLLKDGTYKHDQQGIAAPSSLAPRTMELEWGGTVGSMCIMIALPVVVGLLYLSCDSAERCPPLAFLDPEFRWSSLPRIADMFDVTSAYIFLGWLAFQAALYVWLPGPVKQGVVLRDGKTRLDYRCNGLASLIVSLLCYAAGWWYGLFTAEQIASRYLTLATAATVLCFTFAALLYFASVRDNAVPALGGNTGEIWYDFFVGRELNPRLGSFDFKFFCELRPGLTAWAILNISHALAQYEATGSVTNAMILVNLFQLWYVADSVMVESAVLTTMDIVHDGFGWMLVFGDLAWVPFTYSLQARFLYVHPVELSLFAVAAIVAIQLTGYTIFRLANLQKNNFRRDPKDPSVAHLKFLKTASGSKLLISGWWGAARHVNYTGDWIMAVAWCLPCGFTHLLPYFYAIYFGILLVHRELRDEHNCRKKYGKDWDRYCEIVPYRFVPGLF